MDCEAVRVIGPSLANLKRLDLCKEPTNVENSRVACDGASRFAKCCPNLVHVNMALNKLADEGFRALCRIPKLNYLSLTGNKRIGHFVLPELRYCLSLTYLAVEGCSFTKVSL